ncbi:MAG: leucine-rich repeat protein [Bacteroidaceae bacterium]|nr:leucine-rich repeat protein [Bacteroidaceae bacterium]
MSAFLIYILKVALLTAVLVLLYHLLLRRDTFHRTARIVLVVSLFISYILPLCVITVHRPISASVGNDVAAVRTQTASTTASERYQAQSPAQQPQVQSQAVVPSDTDLKRINWIVIATVIYATGVVSLIVLRLISVRKVTGIIRSGRVLMEKEGCRIVISKDNIRPFSWMRNIVLPEGYAGVSWTSPVVQHESSHISHHHTLELLVADILSAFQWFNPAVWLLRHDLCCVQEFEADASVLEVGIDRAVYERSLLSIAAGGFSIPLVNGLGESSLRARIRMMNSNRSSRALLLKLVYLPVLIVVSLSLTSNKVYDRRQAPYVLTTGETMPFIRRNLYEYPDSDFYYQGLKFNISNGVAVITGCDWRMVDSINSIPTSIPFKGKDYDVRVIMSLSGTHFVNLVIPEGITEIGVEAFSRCNQLESVTIPSTVCFMEASVFKGCSNLKTVFFENGLTALSQGMFMNCRNLESVHLPSTLNDIGDGAFSDCRHLQDINLPKRLERIGNEAFYRCVRLSLASLPRKLKQIGNGAFYDCRSLMVDKSSLKAEIGVNAFYVEQL